jgi:DNA ligase D-like protein (predicted ligase)
VTADQLTLEVGGVPSAVRPMQASTVEAPFSSPDYLFEVKWDGLRTVMFVHEDGTVRIHDRGLNDLTPLFPELAPAADQVPTGTVLDGELVLADAEGRPDHGRLRRRLAGEGATGEDDEAAFLAFDALYVDGRSQLRQPLHRRRSRLQRLVAGGGAIFVPEHIEGDGVELYEACLERGLEGVMAKHRESLYIPGQRSPFWLKVKAVKSDDFVVVGWTPGEPFGALLLGFYEEGRLLPCGAVGGGFDAETAGRLAADLVQLEVPQSSLEPAPVMTAPVRWSRPEIVASIRYSDWAPDGTLRFPIFNGRRPEVHPAECVRHRPRVVVEGRTLPGTAAHSLTRFPF